MPASRREFFVAAAGLANTSMRWPARLFADEKPQGSRLEEDGFIRLYSNENAYGPSAKVMDAIRSGVGVSNRYPRLQYGELIQHIAASHQTAADRVLLGCGSTELLRMAATAF